MLVVFAGIAGFMAGIAVAFFVIPLWQPSNASQGWARRYRVVSSAGALFIVVAVTAYVWRGEPDGLGPTFTMGHGTNVMQPEAVDATGNTPTPGSIEQAAIKLALRLRDGKGSDADWNLLKQSYEFLGDTEGAQLAAEHRVKAELVQTQSTDTSGTATAPISEEPAPDTTIVSKLAPYQKRVNSNPNDAESWLAIASLNRIAHQYVAANDAYEHVVAMKKMNATAWADYADSIASQQKSLNHPKVVAALNEALKLDANHLKALWLKASLAHEAGRYQDALAGWQKLLTLVPKDSSDYQLIASNAAEAKQLLGSGDINNSSTESPQIAGSVDVDATVKARITNDMVLFVFAKPVDSPGPPAAVLRVPVTSWPMKFSLDDSLAMMPTRKLSQFKSVTVQARLSRSGQAMQQAGDIQSDAVTVAVPGNRPLTLKLVKVVG
jgi:tetratricopeptide (TPR) repeat protein